MTELKLKQTNKDMLCPKCKIGYMASYMNMIYLIYECHYCGAKFEKEKSEDKDSPFDEDK